MAHATTHDSGASAGSLGSYVTGFVLAILLTLVPFVLVMSGALAPDTTLVVVFAAAVVQILVHLRYFLHLDGSSEQRWNLTALVFTVIVIGLLVGGSIWIMYNLRGRTMIPGAPAPTTSQMLN